MSNRLHFLVFIFCLLSSLLVIGQNKPWFEKNLGQWNDSILYRTHFKEGNIYLKNEKITILIKDKNNSSFHPHGSNDGRERFSVFSMKPLNAKQSKIKENNKVDFFTNYFIGNDKTKHLSRVPCFKNIIYENIYDNIDWDICASEDFVKHTFIVRPSGKVEDIAIEYIGVDSLKIMNEQLHIFTKYGEIIEEKPYIFQHKDNSTKEIQGKYIIKGNILTYSVEDYDKNLDLLIDPGLIFSTYSGSHSDSWGMTSCYDEMGRIISGGIVDGGAYPITEGAYDDTFSGSWDCVITKYNNDASLPIFSTFLGGLKGEMPHSMTVNRNGEIIVFGTTSSGGFPTSDNAFQENFNGGVGFIYETSIDYSSGSDIFITCFSPLGDSIIASTFLGGSGNDGINFKHHFATDLHILYDGNDSLYANYGDIARGEIITDKDNNVYIASCSFSEDFPVSIGAYQDTNRGGQEAVAVKLDRSLSNLIYSTYIGGTNDDAAYSMDLDSTNRLYITGGTTSTDFPTSSNAYNTTFNGGPTDAFLCVLSSDGTILEHSSLFGSNQYDQSFFIRLDDDCYPYIFGQTKADGSTLVHNVGYSIPNSGQFIAKFSPTLDSLRWSTVFGSGDGMVNISPSGFAIDICGRIYCAGWGRIFKYMKNTLGYNSLGSDNLQTTSNAFSSISDGQDFYIMALEADATALNYGSYFGELSSAINEGIDHVDGGTSRFDRYGNLYQTICASCGGSQNLPTTPNAYSSSNNSGNCNMGSLKFEVNNDFAVANFLVPEPKCKNTAISFVNLSRGDSFLWDFGDGSQSIQENPTHTYQQCGLFTVRLIANKNNGCKLTDTITKNVLVLGDTSYYIDTVETCAGVPVQVGLDFFCSSNNNVSYSWYPNENISDSTIINPYYTGTKSVLLRLIINADECKDTIYQYVKTLKLFDGLDDTLHFCSLPYEYLIPTENDLQVNASLYNDFHEQLPISMGKVIINDTSTHFLYISYTKDNCRNIDSIYLKYEGYDFVLQVVSTGCREDNNGSAEVISHSFPTPVHYQWSCSNKDTSKVENLSIGTYTIRVIGEDSCFLEKVFEVNTYSNLNVEAEKTDNYCLGMNNGEIILHITGGLSPYTITWNGANTGTDTILQNLAPDTYTYNVYDNTGCLFSGSVVIKSQDTLHLSLSSTLNNCVTGCSAQITSLINGGTEPYSYSWSNGETTQNLYDVCNGSYSLEITDDRGCKTSSNIEVSNTNIFEDFEAWSSDDTIYDGATTHLFATDIDGLSYQWLPSNNLDSPFSSSTSATLYESTDFSVFATDNKGCTKEASLHIEVEFVNCGEPNIFVPNAFTPNSDGVNDFVQVSGDYIASFDFAIYDRWGEKVFSTNKIDEAWDGTFRGKVCQAGVYFYKLTVNCEGGKTYLKGGDITLIR